MATAERHHGPTPPAAEAPRPEGTPPPLPTSEAPRQEKTPKQMVNEPGFLAFLGKATKGIPFNYETNPEETKKYYEAFLASKKNAPIIRDMLMQQIKSEKGGIINAEERVRVERAVEAMAAESPEMMASLSEELENIRTFPERKAALEAEYRQQAAALSQTREELEGLMRDRAAAAESLSHLPDPASAPEKGFFKRLAQRLTNAVGELTSDQLAESKHDEWTTKIAELDTRIAELQGTLASAMTPEALQATVAEATQHFENMRLTILGSLSTPDEKGNRTSVLETTRQRLANEVTKRFTQGIATNDLMAVAKLGQEFKHFAELANTTNADYLAGKFTAKDAAGKDVEVAFDRAAFEKMLTEKLEGKVDATGKREPGLIEVGIMEALASIPPNSTEARMESALQKFISLANEGIGLRTKAESMQFVIDVLNQAYAKAVAEGDDTGKALFLAAQISRLERSVNPTS